MVSSKAGLARPVRTLARLFFNAAMDCSILVSVVFLISAIVMGGLQRRCAGGPQKLSSVHQRALVFTHHHAQKCAMLDDGEHTNRQLLIAAQSKSRRIHDAEVAV